MIYIPSYTISTVVGTGSAGYNGNNLPGWQSKVSGPIGIWLDSNGVLYFVDAGNYIVRKVDTYQSNSIVSVFAGTAMVPGDSGDGGPATSATLFAPFGICGLSNGVIYIVDTTKSRIRSVVEGIIDSAAGISDTLTCEDGPTLTATFGSPYLCRPDNNGNILIADGFCNKIRLFNPLMNVVTSIIGSGAVGLVNAAWTNAVLNGPMAVYTDTVGNIFVSDSMNNIIRVQTIQANASTYVVAGSSLGISGSATNRTATSAIFHSLRGIFVDTGGNIFISDPFNFVIRYLNASTRMVVDIAGNARGTLGLDNVPATQVKLSRVIDIICDSSGTIYLTDRVDNRIRKLTIGNPVSSYPSFAPTYSPSLPSPTIAPTPSPSRSPSFPPWAVGKYSISTVIGTGYSDIRFPDTAATDTSLEFPTSIWLDSLGNLFVADSTVIWVVDAYTTNPRSQIFAGTLGMHGNDGDFGLAVEALLDFPEGVCGLPNGEIYIADTGNNRIRQVFDGIITPMAGTGFHQCLDGNALAAAFQSLGSCRPTNDGNILFTDRGCNAIRLLNVLDFTISTLSVGSIPSAGTANLISLPSSAYCDTVGNIFIADLGNNRILELSAMFSILSLIAGNISGYPGISTNSPATSSFLNTPMGVYVDTLGNIFISDSGNGYISKVDANTRFLTRIAGNSTGSPLFIPLMANRNILLTPSDIIGDTFGNIYFIEADSFVVRKLTYNYPAPSARPTTFPTGPPVILPTIRPISCSPSFIPTLPPTTLPSYLPTTSPTATPTLAPTSRAPTMLPTITPSTFPSFAPVSNYVPKYTISTVVGTDIAAASGDGLPGWETPLLFPISVWLDSVGTLFLSDLYTVRSVPSQSVNGIVTRLAGQPAKTGNTGDNGPATSAYLNYIRGICGLSNGRIFVADTGNYRIRSIYNGIITAVAGNNRTQACGDGTGTSASFNYPTDCIADKNGNLLIADYGCNSIRLLNATTNSVKVLIGATASGRYQFTAGGITGVFSDTSGNIFFVDNGGALIRKLPFGSGPIVTVAGSAKGNTDNVLATNAGLSNPYAVYLDSTGNIFISDYGNGWVRVVNASTRIISRIAGSDVNGIIGNDNGDALNSQLYPYGLCGDSLGNLFFADIYDGRVHKLTPGSPISSYPTIMPTAPTRGPTLNPSIIPTKGPTLLPTKQPTKAPVVPPSRSPSVAPTSRNPTITPSLHPSVLPSIKPTNSPTDMPSFGPVTNYVPKYTISTLVGSGALGSSATGLPAWETQLSGVSGLWLDSLGTLFFSDSYTVRSVPPLETNAVVSIVAGQPGISGYSGDGGPATSAALSAPAAICGLPNGRLFVSDMVNRVIRSISNGTITTLAGLRSSTTCVDGGSNIATFKSPFQCSTDTNGNILVVDSGCHSIRMINLQQDTVQVSTIIGHLGITGFEVGIGTQAYLRNPFGLLVDPLGNIYFSDSGNYRIRLQHADFQSNVTVVAGTGVSGSLDNCPATSASFTDPRGIFVDSAGNIFITDYGYAWIRVINSTTGIISRIAGSNVAGIRGNDNGDALLTRLMKPFQITGDSLGNLYFADVDDYRIRKLTPGAPISSYPTLIPSASPSTAVPSYSFIPSLIPSAAPSLDPTVDPTMTPSYNPTVIPSLDPTIVPSEIPSFTPSAVPSSQPSESPTIIPSSEPSAIPTDQPTSSPTCFPLASPTALPSNTPTVIPSMVPSSKPSGIPSETPTMIPTELPSVVQSYLPSIPPSFIPSIDPSLEPTWSPSSVFPSEMPTYNPSPLPSQLPATIEPSSSVPSELPTSSTIPLPPPSNIPSLEPTSFSLPSSMPSISSTSSPSSLMTASPSILTDPTYLPTTTGPVQISECPSSIPSGLPSPNPSTCPSSVPSSQPSCEPSTRPSECPVWPSGIPSRPPTTQPTRRPSTQPTMIPSEQPFSQPTSRPTFRPSPRSSIQPSRNLSDKPSSHEPSNQPTCQPSRRPTAQPTSQPSSQPISHPSASPTATPTLFVSPTPVPSQYPTPSTSSVRVPTVTPSFIPSCAPTSTLSAFPDFRIFKGWLFMFGAMVGGLQSVHSNIYLTGSYVGSSYVVLGRSKREEDVTLQGQSSWEGVMEVSDGGVQQDSVSRSTTNVGDINRDGKDDWVLGDPSSSRGYVLFGESSSLTNLRVSVMLVESADSSSSTRSGLGWACAGLGDMNVDGYGDFIVTAPTGNVAYVVYGRAKRNFPSQLVLSLMSSRQGYKIVGSGRDRSFGMSVSSGGDFNGDGRRDILISALRFSSSSQATIYVIVGNGSSVIGGAEGGVSGKPLVVSVDGLGNSSYFKIVSVKGSFTGLSMSWLGDMNGDGYDDVGIGSAPYQSGGSVQQQTYVVYGRDWVGSRSGVNAVGVVGGESGIRNVLWLSGMRSGVDGFVVRGGGFMVSGLGDVDGDGLSDMMVSSYGGWLGKGNAYITVYPNNITHFPSVAPSSRPSLSPTSALTIASTFPPNIPASISPSHAPLISRSPTRASSFPSLAPSKSKFPTLTPSTATTKPSPQSSVISSKKPTLIPSITKTRRPIKAPTSYPSTAFPTERWTEVSSSGDIKIEVNYTGDFHPPDVMGTAKKNLIISVNGSVHIMGSQGRTIYTILHSEDGSTNSEISIEVFRDDYDQLDLSAFPEYRGLGDLPHESPPLRLLLSSRQSVVLENHRSYDLSASSVVFAGGSSGSSSSSSSFHLSKKQQEGALVVACLFCALIVMVVGGRYYYLLKISEEELKERQKQHASSLKFVDLAVSSKTSSLTNPSVIKKADSRYSLGEIQGFNDKWNDKEEEVIDIEIASPDRPSRKSLHQPVPAVSIIVAEASSSSNVSTSSLDDLSEEFFLMNDVDERITTLQDLGEVANQEVDEDEEDYHHGRSPPPGDNIPAYADTDNRDENVSSDEENADNIGNHSHSSSEEDQYEGDLDDLSDEDLSKNEDEDADEDDQEELAQEADEDEDGNSSDECHSNGHDEDHYSDDQTSDAGSQRHHSSSSASSSDRSNDSSL